jgi:outer membrane protein
MKKIKQRIVLSTCSLAGLMFVCSSALAESGDPFSTLGLVAPTQSGSVHQSLLASPCKLDAINIESALSLPDIVERALCNNPQTREAWANARYQAAQVGISKSAYLPSINLGGSATHNRSDSTSYNQQSVTASLS